MKKAKKILVMVAALALTAAIAVGGTLAYLTSKTEVVKNTFTVGKVAITLDEAKVDEYGVEVAGAERVTANQYKLMPGHTYVKDPTVTVVKGSEVSYVRMLVTINKQAALDAIFAPDGLPLDKFFGGISADWSLVKETENADDTRTYEFWHKATVDAREADVVLDDLFETITVPGSVTNTQLDTIEGLKIDVVAHAIQADGFADAAAAWSDTTTNWNPVEATPAE